MLRVGDFIDAHRNRQRCSDSCFVTTKVAYSDTDSKHMRYLYHHTMTMIMM